MQFLGKLPSALNSVSSHPCLRNIVSNDEQKAQESFLLQPGYGAGQLAPGMIRPHTGEGARPCLLKGRTSALHQHPCTMQEGSCLQFSQPQDEIGLSESWEAIQVPGTRFQGLLWSSHSLSFLGRHQGERGEGSGWHRRCWRQVRDPVSYRAAEARGFRSLTAELGIHPLSL